MATRLDGGDGPERGEALRERAVTGTDFQDRAREVRSCQIDDPVAIVLGIVE